MPSALVSVVMEPAALGSGVATVLSPTFPMLTRRNSSTPSFEGRSLEGRTAMVFAFGGRRPCIV